MGRLFDNNTLVKSFEETFYGCLGVRSAVPTFWISHPGIPDHNDCILGVTNASNYASISADWK